MLGGSFPAAAELCKFLQLLPPLRPAGLSGLAGLDKGEAHQPPKSTARLGLKAAGKVSRAQRRQMLSTATAVRRPMRMIPANQSSCQGQQTG